MLCGSMAAMLPAQAAWFSTDGNTVTLRGMIVEGDAERLQAALRGTDSRRMRILRLESGGGEVTASVKLAATIRKEKLVTMVDAARSYCDSGCTLAFVAGVRRHYVGGDQIHEGLSSAYYGLGFHPAHSRFASGRLPGQMNPGASRALEKVYREMGTPKAIDLMHRAAFNTYFRPNGRTAMAMGIATSLAAP
ncbi:MAG: hypothetical protein ACRCXM_15620 [Beijerinckiaceae bacterium]